MQKFELIYFNLQYTISLGGKISHYFYFILYIYCMSGFMKTVSKTACTKIAGMFLGNRSDSVHEYGHVVLRLLSTLCTLNRSYGVYHTYASL